MRPASEPVFLTKNQAINYAHNRAAFAQVRFAFWIRVDGHLRRRLAHHPWSIRNVPELRGWGVTININREVL